jgi:hypothetical protein
LKVDPRSTTTHTRIRACRDPHRFFVFFAASACASVSGMPRVRPRVRSNDECSDGADSWPRSYGGRSRGVFGALTYPHLILPYSAHYGQLASHYGGHWCSSIPWWCDEKLLKIPKRPIYVKMAGSPVLSVLTMGSLHTKPPPYDFLNLYGACLQAPRTPKMK